MVGIRKAKTPIGSFLGKGTHDQHFSVGDAIVLYACGLPMDTGYGSKLASSNILHLPLNNASCIRPKVQPLTATTTSYNRTALQQWTFRKVQSF
jgi:hypothetical protein